MTVNRCTLLGQIGRDAETRAVGSASVTEISVATDHRWKDKSGEWKEETDWHRVTIWNCDAYRDRLRKGVRVYVEGRMRTRSYEQNGEKRYATDIIAERVITLGSTGGARDGTGGSGASGGAVRSGAHDDIPF